MRLRLYILYTLSEGRYRRCDNALAKVDPTYAEIIAAIDAFDFTGYEEFVFCGYGEPTCALEMLEKTAKYVKDKYHLPIRVNTNGLGNLYHGRDIVPELAEYIDSVSISLNAANAEEYNKVTRPTFDNAYEAMLDFAEECNRMIKHTQLSILDVLPEEDIRLVSRLLMRGVSSEDTSFFELGEFRNRV